MKISFQECLVYISKNELKAWVKLILLLNFFKGLLSSLIRDLVNASTDGPRWLILDGDIDPMWIESLNSVMDDNRVKEDICLCYTKSLVNMII